MAQTITPVVHGGRRGRWLGSVLAHALGAAARAGRLSPVVVADTEPGETHHVLDGVRLRAPVVAAPMALERYRVPGTPFAVILDELGVVRAKGTVNNLEQLEGLVDTARRRGREAGNGAPVP